MYPLSSYFFLLSIAWYSNSLVIWFVPIFLPLCLVLLLCFYLHCYSYLPIILNSAFLFCHLSLVYLMLHGLLLLCLLFITLIVFSILVPSLHFAFLFFISYSCLAYSSPLGYRRFLFCFVISCFFSRLLVVLYTSFAC